MCEKTRTYTNNMEISVCDQQRGIFGSLLRASEAKYFVSEAKYFASEVKYFVSEAKYFVSVTYFGSKIVTVVKLYDFGRKIDLLDAK